MPTSSRRNKLEKTGSGTLARTHAGFVLRPCEGMGIRLCDPPPPPSTPSRRRTSVQAGWLAHTGCIMCSIHCIAPAAFSTLSPCGFPSPCCGWAPEWPETRLAQKESDEVKWGMQLRHRPLGLLTIAQLLLRVRQAAWSSRRGELVKGPVQC